eukprot:TRINITY_DN7282_c0_g1_i3.p1 TRINITY_DN7282_c0_g1~~TRINITY_DN7282_c0_g1_i3.p1  ORF type:complete len:129 (+),score=4.97 TRINITY_DN7282_c0_g1_i3:432-818(+)
MARSSNGSIGLPLKIPFCKLAAAISELESITKSQEIPSQRRSYRSKKTSTAIGNLNQNHTFMSSAVDLQETFVQGFLKKRERDEKWFTRKGGRDEMARMKENEKWGNGANEKARNTFYFLLCIKMFPR